jgi:hypothetical protein
MSIQGKLAILLTLNIAMAIQVGACQSPSPTVPCGDKLCASGEFWYPVHEPRSGVMDRRGAS